MYFLTTRQSVYSGSKLFVKQFVSSEGTKGNLTLLAQTYRTIWHRNKLDGCAPRLLKSPWQSHRGKWTAPHWQQHLSFYSIPYLRGIHRFKASLMQCQNTLNEGFRSQTHSLWGLSEVLVFQAFLGTDSFPVGGWGKTAGNMPVSPCFYVCQGRTAWHWRVTKSHRNRPKHNRWNGYPLLPSLLAFQALF